MVPSIWLFDCRLFLVSLTISFQFGQQMLVIGLCCLTFWILTLETFWYWIEINQFVKGYLSKLSMNVLWHFKNIDAMWKWIMTVMFEVKNKAAQEAYEIVQCLHKASYNSSSEIHKYANTNSQIHCLYTFHIIRFYHC